MAICLEANASVMDINYRKVDQTMEPDAVFNLTKEAFLDNKFKQLIMGEGKYRIPQDQYHAAVHPTNWMNLLRYGVVPLLKQDYSGAIKNSIRKSLLAVAKSGPIGAWCVFNLHYYWFSSVDANGLVKLFDNEIRHTLRVSLLGKKHLLMKIADWSGKDYKYGLWGDIMEADSILDRNFNAGIFTKQERMELQR